MLGVTTHVLCMQAFAAINAAGDQPFWVARSVFLEQFDQADFLNRDVKVVTAAYLEDWFYIQANDQRMFYIPVVGALGRRTDLIGSRHRLAVLLPHLEEIPFAFAFEHLAAESMEFLNSIPKRPLDLSQPMWLPDLPVRKQLP